MRCSCAPTPPTHRCAPHEYITVCKNGRCVQSCEWLLNSGSGQQTNYSQQQQPQQQQNQVQTHVQTQFYGASSSSSSSEESVEMTTTTKRATPSIFNIGQWNGTLNVSKNSINF